MLKPEQITAAAQAIYAAEKNRVQIQATSLDYPDMTMDDAYAIQKSWVDMKIADGRKIKGYKIGLTSRAMQDVMKINEPDYGVLLDDMFFEDGGDIETTRFTDPRIEVELAFVLKDRLEGEVSMFEVLNATDYVVPALELIAARSHRVDPDTGYVRTVLDTISDNAANEIITTAERMGADLIVMASHRPHMQDHLIGPNATKVVGHSSCTVMVVRDLNDGDL